MGQETSARQDQAHPLGWKDIKGFIDSAGESFRADRERAMLCVSYETLARRGELVALEVRDIDFHPDDTGQALIRRGKTDAGQQQIIRADVLDLMCAESRDAVDKIRSLAGLLQRISKIGRNRKRAAEAAHEHSLHAARDVLPTYRALVDSFVAAAPFSVVKGFAVGRTIFDGVGVGAQPKAELAAANFDATKPAYKAASSLRGLD